MSVWVRDGQPSDVQMPCFQGIVTGTTGQACSPSRSGFTACHTSTYG